MSEATVVLEAKPWWRSKTVIVNLLAGAAVAVDYATGAGFGFVSQSWFVGLVAAINFGLRFVTDRPVAGSTDKLVDVKVEAK